MKVGLKEAYEMARKVLPGCKVNIEVEYGMPRYGIRDVEKLSWTVYARPEEGDQVTETDEIFTVALAKASAELARAKAKPVEDVIVEEKGQPQASSSSEEKTDEPIAF